MNLTCDYCGIAPEDGLQECSECGATFCNQHGTTNEEGEPICVDCAGE